MLQNLRQAHHLRQTGVTLIELMVGIVLALIIIAAVGAIYLQNQRSYIQDESVSRMQENARYALQVMSHDLALMGFWGRIFDPSTINPDTTLTSVGIGTDCGPGTAWAYETGYDLVRYSSAVSDGVSANNSYNCIASAEFQPSTSILAVKHASSINIEDVELSTNSVYLRTNGTDSSLFYGDTPPALPAIPGATTPNWSHIAHVYFIRNHSVTAGDGIPTLCREYLKPGSPPTMSTDGGCIADNIENFEIFFGIDTDEDGIANQYKNNPTATELADAVSARIFLLARTTTQDFQYTDTKTYNLGSASLGPYNDNYHRRVYTTTVSLRNPSNLIRAGF